MANSKQVEAQDAFFVCPPVIPQFYCVLVYIIDVRKTTDW